MVKVTANKPQGKKYSGVFSSLDLQENDRLHFLGKGEVEVVRGDRVVCRVWCHDYAPELQPLRKRAAASKTEAKPDLKLTEGAEKSKKEHGPIPPGAKWITVNPSGEPGNGVPILILPQEDGSATVLGGAGGKMNMLKLSGLRSPEEWRESARERAKEKRKKEKERTEAQSEEEKVKEKQDIEKVKGFQQSAVHDNALKTLASLDQAGIDIGLSDEHKQALQQPPDPGADQAEVDRWKQLTKEATQAVKAIHQAYENKLVTDESARAAAQLGDGDLDVDNRVVENRNHTAMSPDGELFSQITQLPGGEWMVTGDRTEMFSSWQEAAKQHLRNVLESEQDAGGDRTQGESFYSPANWVKEPKPENLPEGFQFDPAVALEVARLSAERRAADKAAKDGEEAVKKRSPLEMGSGFDIPVVQEITQQDVLSKLESHAKTLKDAAINNAFLELIEDQGDAQKLKKHHMIGGYSMIAEVASEVLKQNPISRQLIDVLGHNEGAKVLAFMMRQNLSPEEYDRVTAAMAAQHAQTSTWHSKGATKQTQKMMERLEAVHNEIILLNEFAEGELDAAQQTQLDSLMYEASSLEQGIQQVLGTALGRLQASAAMVAALEAKPKTLRFSGDGYKAIAKHLPGALDDDGNPKPSIFDGYGLTDEDFKQFSGPGGDMLQINPSGMAKLAVGYNPEDREAYERAVAIKRGDFDEPDFVPEGFSHYSKASFSDALTEAQQFDTSFELLGKLAASEGVGGGTMSLFGDPEPASEPIGDQEVEDGLRGYIGARVANGENPLDVMADVRSPEFYMQQGLDPYGAAALRVQNIAANMVKQAAGNANISDKAVISAFQEMGDAEAAKQRRARQTDDLQSLHNQTIEKDAAVEAAHRTLSAMPMARTVFKAWGDLSAKEKKWIKEYAITEVLGEALDAPKVKKKPGDDIPDAVAEDQYDLFGNKISASEALGQEAEADELTQWEKLSKLMGGQEKAIAAVRDHLRGKFMHRFANAYGAISGKPPLIGGENISHVDKLLIAKMPESQREEMLEFMRQRQQSDVAKVRSRTGGKFASEMDDEWMTKYEEIKGNNRQISLLAAETGRSTAKVDFQRTTLGKNAEAMLHEAMQDVIPNFEQINSPVAVIPEVTWGAGTQHATKQRALKFLEAQKKVGIHFGAGSGKSSIMLGCFSHLHAQGKVKKMIVCVPSSIVGQFVGEAATFMKPGEYKYNANLGMSREDRIKAYTDPNLHVHVTTRESFANDLLHLVEHHHGVTPEQYRELPEHEQKELMLRAAKSAGIETEGLLLSVDEAQDITARGNLDPSKRSLALNHLGHHAGHYIQATGDMIKNDLTEAYHFLHAVAPDKFNDQSKFMAEYGGNTAASRRALQRAISPYSFAASTKPQDKGGRTLKMNQYQPKIQVSDRVAKGRQQILDDIQYLSDWQSKRREELKEEHGEGYKPSTADFNTAWGDPKVKEILDRLGSQDTWHSMDDDGKAQSVGGQIMALGGLKRTALFRLYHLTPYEDNPKMQWTVDHAVKKFKEEGKPGIIFSSSSAAGEMLVEALKKKGMRVAYIHGGLDGNGKDRERLKFQSDAPEADILVATDAARTGVNLTRGKVLYHYDVPLTEMSYSQRSARIHRLKQSEDTEIYTPQLDAPEEKIAWSRMERKGAVAKPLKAKAENIDETGLARKLRESQQRSA